MSCRTTRASRSSRPSSSRNSPTPPEDARKRTLDLLSQYPEGELDAIHVGCRDQLANGVVQALGAAGRTDVLVTAIDGGPNTLEVMAEEASPFVANVAQQPNLIGSTAAMNVARHFAGEELLPQSCVDVFPVNGREEAKAACEALGYGALD